MTVGGAQVTTARMRGLIRKSVIFFENMDCNHRPLFASSTPPAMVEFGLSGSWPMAGPIKLGGHAFDALTALIEASRAVVSKDQLFEPRLARHDRRQAPAVERKIAALRKGL